jgi:hypothetical protein
MAYFQFMSTPAPSVKRNSGFLSHPLIRQIDRIRSKRLIAKLRLVISHLSRDATQQDC